METLLDLHAEADANEAVDPEFEAWVALQPGADRHFYTTVAGVSFPNDDGSDRQALLLACNPRDPLLLVRDPKNPVHPKAVKVMTTGADGKPGRQLGYLQRRTADELTLHLARGERFAAAVCARREAGSRMDANGERVPVHGLAIVIFHLR